MTKCSKISKTILIGLFIGALSACEATEDPSVYAGTDQSINEGTSVSLSATVTDIVVASIEWTQISGTTVQLSNSTAQAPTFTAPSILTDETLVFQVTVTDEFDETVSDTVSINVVAYAAQQATETSAWLMNSTATSTFIKGSDGDVLENIESVEAVTITDEDDNAVQYSHVKTSGIPNYDITMTQDIIDQLNARPKALTDFVDGQTSVQVGDTISFGADMGYNSSTENCNDTGGDGYWPPGPGCPTEQSVDAYFTLSPEALSSTDDTCETGLGTVGLLVNGAALFNWGDGQSYGDDLWYNLAPVAEQYDVDICAGHAANGEYHHHFYTSCLADTLEDDGTAHSPIYGYAADGFALYGPYEYATQLALTGWQARDYSAPISEGGCNTQDERSCVLVDQYDISKGVTDAVNGPDIGDPVTTLSGNVLPAADGFYFEDYYYTQAAVSGPQLDEHNGHDTNDGKGYHYHITLTKDADGNLSPAFPYQIGPRFKGSLPDNSVGRCSTSDGGLPPRLGLPPKRGLPPKLGLAPK